MNNQKSVNLLVSAVICVIASVSVSGMKLSQRYQYPSDCLNDMLSEARRKQHSIRVAGVHDALSAQIFQQQYGLKIQQRQKNSKSTVSSLPSVVPLGLFVSGFGVSAARLGKPDMSILTRYEQEDTARNIIHSVSLSTFDPPPVIVDGDTGFGGTANVRETIRRMAAIKAAAITIEDQVFPKKCTYIAGSGINIVSREDATDRVKTALAAKQEAEEADGNRILVIARTDCRMALGLDEAIERCLAYQKLGADIVYAENLQSKDEYVVLRKAMIGGGDAKDLSSFATSDVAPMILAQFQTGKEDQRLYSVDEVSSIGYEMTLYGVTGLQATVSALESVAAEVLNDDCGGIVTSTPLATLEQIKDVVGFSDLDSFEQKYGCT